MANPRRFVATTATDVAPVAAIPTTAAHFALYNGELSGGKTYTVTAVGFTTTTSAAAVIKLQQLANVMFISPPISGTAANGPQPTDGQVNNSKAMVASAVTIKTGGTWHPVGTSVDFGAQTATIALGNWTPVRGIYILPPGGLLSLAVLCSAAGSAKCICSVTWEEEVL
jgi:hypothetical protein